MSYSSDLDPASWSRTGLTGVRILSTKPGSNLPSEEAWMRTWAVRSRSQAEVADLRILERLGPWPVQPLVMRANASPAEVTEVRERLLAAADDPRLIAEMANAGLTKLVEVDADHYAAVHAAMARLG